MEWLFSNWEEKTVRWAGYEAEGTLAFIHHKTVIIHGICGISSANAVCKMIKGIMDLMNLE